MNAAQQYPRDERTAVLASPRGAAWSSSADLREGLARDRFPILERRVHDHPLIYLDTAATSQKPEAVILAEADYYRRLNANVHRGMHSLAQEATEAYEACRAAVATWLDAPEPEAVVITRSATASLNLVARGWERQLREGDEVLLTEMEHHANLVPWLMLAERRGIRVRYLPLTPGGELDLTALPRLLGPRTRVVALTHVSNVLGTINPVAEVAAAARRAGALVVVDAAQSVGHLPVSFRELGADLLVFSAHKTYGPMGLGFLVGRADVLERLDPLEGGGEMIETVTWEGATWTEVPHRFEAGTPNVAAAAAFPPAIALLQELGAERVREHELALNGYAWERLSALGGLRLFGPAAPERRGGLISFHDPLIHPHDMATLLDQQGVAVRAGHHCAQPLHRRLGVVATTRASFGIYNRSSDVDALVEGIRFARKVLGA
jgi:cysteine desulfurase/selenocysteine lyase